MHLLVNAVIQPALTWLAKKYDENVHNFFKTVIFKNIILPFSLNNC